MSRAGEAWGRVRGNWWPVLQQAVAAAVSWWAAGLAFDHHLPVFAPIATLVALNTPLGRRGTNAVRVVSGVIVGVVVGHAAFRLLGHGAPAIGTAVLAALLAALLLGGERITMAQAAVSAVVSVVAGQQAGLVRVEDALFGAAVALVFSQVLFPAHPVTLLVRAQTKALRALGDVLDVTARTLRSKNERIDRFWDDLRPLYSLLDDLAESRERATAVARLTRYRRGNTEAVRREIASARHLNLLGNSCLTLIRGAMALDEGHRAAFAPDVEALTRTVGLLADEPRTEAVRGRATRAAEHIVPNAPDTTSPQATAVWQNLRLAVGDLTAFASAERNPPGARQG
ncbi:FUSC family protein [Streptomyces diastaticus]|uniref:FUSC family protein n=1 Tax=Streptomyces TaxID=1883 RepID=UPI000FC0D0AE|nr:FUSC family protein [Streptomyces sp. ADI98-12]NEE27359.1 aromatic acid exporter family protein [Streptomyces sp. SID7982]NEE50313.1 aromatic acid exporter family protein [Streptomyces sp. SID8455]RPK88147.1 hypothetical protein EES47_14970 [Streptomyces sp. ADI98-12]